MAKIINLLAGNDEYLAAKNDEESKHMVNLGEDGGVLLPGDTILVTLDGDPAAEVVNREVVSAEAFPADNCWWAYTKRPA